MVIGLVLNVRTSKEEQLTRPAAKVLKFFNNTFFYLSGLKETVSVGSA